MDSARRARLAGMPQNPDEMLSAVSESLAARTGRSLEEWLALVRSSGVDPLDQAAVRGWLRRFGERAEAARSVFTVWLRAVDADPVMPGPAGSGFTDAMMAITALAAAIGRRFVLSEVSLAETAVAVSGGRLLAPGWPSPVVQHESTLPSALITP